MDVELTDSIVFTPMLYSACDFVSGLKNLHNILTSPLVKHELEVVIKTTLRLPIVRFIHCAT